MAFSTNYEEIESVSDNTVFIGEDSDTVNIPAMKIKNYVAKNTSYQEKTNPVAADSVQIWDSEANVPKRASIGAIMDYVEDNSSVINSLTNNILIVKTYTDGGIIYIDKLNKILHVNLFISGNTASGGLSIATITGFTPPSSNRDISFPVYYSDNSLGYGVLRVDTTGAIKVYAHKSGNMVNVSITGECYIG